MVMVLHKKKLRMDVATTSSSISDWARVPKNILDLILDKLVSLSDYVRFGAVCVDWNTVALEDRNHRNRCTWHHQIPMLMLPSEHHDESVSDFYSVRYERKLESFQLRVPCHKRFIGSSLGWLISVDSDFTVTLFNPFSKSPNNNTIRILPPVVGPKVTNQDHNFNYGRPGEIAVFNHEYFFVKAILSAEPTLHPHQYILMVIYGSSRRLGFIAPDHNNNNPNVHDETAWVYIEGNDLQGFLDVIYTNGLFYALRESGELILLEIDVCNQCKVSTAHVTPILRTEHPCNMRYVVESCGGDLLQVLRFEESYQHRLDESFSSAFKVFKFNRDCHDTDQCWIELKSLGDDVLFLGDNASLSVLASDFPRRCRPGSIYFTIGFHPEYLVLKQPFNSKVPLDMAMYDLEEQCFDEYNLDLDALWKRAMLNRPPIWVVPTFQDARVKRPD